MNNLRYLLLIALTLVIAAGNNFGLIAQTTTALEQTKTAPVETGTFVRKSITLVPFNLTGNSNIQAEMLDAAQTLYQTGRFDYNKVPSEVLNSAQTLFSSKSSTLNYTDLKAETNIGVLADILRKSGVIKEVIKYAGNADVLKERNEKNKKRSTTTALEQSKITGPTVKEMLVLLNGCFVGVTILNELKDGGEKPSGYIFWLRFDVSDVTEWDNNNLPNVDQVKVFLTDVKAVSTVILKNPVQKEFNSDWSLSDIYSYESPAETQKSLEARGSRQFVRQAVLRALSLDEFKIRGTIQDVSEGYRFDAGKKEGVYLDQGYKVYEMRMGEDNKPYTEYMGFGRVDQVADNTTKQDALSALYAITGSYDQGYTVVSHDRALEITLKPNYSMINIPKNVFANLGLPNYFLNDAGSAFALTLNAMYNLAPQTKIKQFYAGISVSGLLPLEEPAKLYVDANAFTIAWNANLYFQKKFWFKGVNFNIGVGGGLDQLRLTWTDKSVEYAISKSSYGIQGDAGLEFALNADNYLGFDLGYRYVLDGYVTSYSVGGKEIPLGVEVNNGLDLGGLKIGLHYTLSLAPLF